MPDGNNLIPLPPPRIPYHPDIKERFEIDAAGWRALIDAVWPAAKTMNAVVMALSYCKARHLDPFKRPVHIVPVWSTEASAMVESVWPGIGELRTTAFRTRLYAGRDATEFGPDRAENLDGVEITYPEWAQVTVYRLSPGGDRMPFPGPRVYWLETYATAKRTTTAPNSMWKKRPRGQLDKCAEAAALRAAFPEELGNDYAADEMAGQIIDHDGPPPPRPRPENYATEIPVSVEQTEPTASFEITDFVGEVTEYATAEEARDALLKMIGEARSLKVLDGLWESNTASGALVDIADAIEDGAESLHLAYAEAKKALTPPDPNPGNGQDRPGTGAQQTDPARGATSSVDTASQTEHPEGESSTPTSSSERSTTQELPAARAATPAAATNPPNESPRDEGSSLAFDMARYKAAGKATNWKGMAADMVAKIATLTDPADTAPAPDGRFLRDNGQTLELMKVGDRDAWSEVSYRLNNRHRVLSGGEP